VPEKDRTMLRITWLPAIAAVFVSSSGIAFAQPNIRPAGPVTQPQLNAPPRTLATPPIIYQPNGTQRNWPNGGYNPTGRYDPRDWWTTPPGGWQPQIVPVYPVYPVVPVTPVVPLWNPIINPGPVIPAAFNPVLTPILPLPLGLVRQPGVFVNAGRDLQVNPWSGTIYRPSAGVVLMNDGSLFFEIAGAGNSGVFYNPASGTLFNPQSNLLLRPGQSLVVPLIP
jgi:hypothetical protein